MRRTITPVRRAVAVAGLSVILFAALAAPGSALAATSGVTPTTLMQRAISMASRLRAAGYSVAVFRRSDAQRPPGIPPKVWLEMRRSLAARPEATLVVTYPSDDRSIARLGQQQTALNLRISTQGFPETRAQMAGVQALLTALREDRLRVEIALYGSHADLASEEARRYGLIDQRIDGLVAYRMTDYGSSRAASASAFVRIFRLARSV
jgi:hypothetical protein